jgi:hypothetical protein
MPKLPILVKPLVTQVLTPNPDRLPASGELKRHSISMSPAGQGMPVRSTTGYSAVSAVVLSCR